MKSKSRTSAAAAPPAKAASAAPPLGASLVAVAIVALLIACYLVVFYQAREFRAQVVGRLFQPQWLWQDVTGAAYDAPLGVLDRAPLILVAACIVAAAWATGSLIVRAWNLDARLTRLETELFSAGVGLSLWSTWTLLVGLLGMLPYAWIVWLPAIVVAPLAGFQLANRRAKAPSATTAVARAALPGDAQDNWLWPSMLALGTPFVVIFVLAGLLPSREFDAREYHLQAPKEWYQAGRIDFLPHNVYANMPLGAEMYGLLATAVLPGKFAWWQGALVGKTVQALMSVLAALTLYAAGRRTHSTTAGVVAALVYLSTPWTYSVSTIGWNEGVLGFYLIQSALAVWLWRTTIKEQDDTAARDAAHLLKLAGFLAGAAASVKYTGVLFVVAPLAVAVTVSQRRCDWKSGLVFCVGASAACGLWYAKNAALTGNPVYPLAYRVFGGATRTPDKDEAWREAHAVPRDADGNRYSLPAAAAAASSLLYESNWLSPLLVPLAAMAALIPSARSRRTALWVAALLAFYLAAWWLLTHRVERFWTPALVLVAWLAGLGATWSRHVVWRNILIALIFWGLVFNFGVMTSTAMGEVDYFVALESLFKNEPRDPAIPPRISWEHRYANQHCPVDKTVLLVGDAQPFDLHVAALYNTCFDDVWFDKLLATGSADERRAALAEQRIALVIINWSEIARYRKTYGFASAISRAQVYEELVRNQKLLRPVPVEGLDRRRAEVFEVVP